MPDSNETYMEFIERITSGGGDIYVGLSEIMNVFRNE